MKKFYLILSCCIYLILYLSLSSYAQTTYIYSLASSFRANQTEAPDLIQVPNDNELTGVFVTREVPETACGQAGLADGYFFEDNAGLQFNNPEGFIDQSYSIAFNFQIDEFISPPQWVRLLGFTWGNDYGIYILLSGAPDYGTLEFWPFGTTGETNFFSPSEFYQMILIRNDAGVITVYINGEEFGEFDDSGYQAFYPQPPDNNILWFRDDPSVQANEASPGFVSDIELANYTWTTEEISDKWDEFCSDLLHIHEVSQALFSIFPNPAIDILKISLPTKLFSEVEIIDILGKQVLSKQQPDQNINLDISGLKQGIYFVRASAGDVVISKTFIKN